MIIARPERTNKLTAHNRISPTKPPIQKQSEVASAEASQQQPKQGLKERVSQHLESSLHRTLQTQIAVLGTGAWGTSLANLARANPENAVRTWSRSSAASLESVVADAEVLIVAISMKGIAELAKRLEKIGLNPKTVIVTATKGLDPQTRLSPSKLWQAAFPLNPVVVLSGPNLSKEIDCGQPAATVVSSPNQAATALVQKLMSNDRFRVYTNQDPLGTELGGTLKNVVAIAVGACDGLNLGTNAKCALMTRALPEMVRVGVSLGAQPETFLGLAGLGDLMATCGSRLSRNYRVGYGLAQGKPMEQILEELGATAEGVNTVNVLVEIAKERNITVPIATAVHQMIHGKLKANEVVEKMMSRELKSELDEPTV